MSKVVFKEPDIPNCSAIETYKNEDCDEIELVKVRHFVSDNVAVEFIIFVESKDILFTNINSERFTEYLFEKISTENDSIEFDTIGKYAASDEFKKIISKYIDYKSVSIYLPEFEYSVRE